MAAAAEAFNACGDDELAMGIPPEEACLIVCSFCSMIAARGLFTGSESEAFTTSFVTLTRFFLLASHFSASLSIESWILSVELVSLEGRENLGRAEEETEELLADAAAVD